MSPSRFKLATTSISPLLKTFTVFSLVVGLSGCNENLKDCNGFWDKTFGRDSCTVTPPSPAPKLIPVCSATEFLDAPNNVCNAKAAQSITGLNLPALSVGDKATLAATTDSGLAVSYSSQTVSVCTISGVEVTAIAAGTCTVSANQIGDATHLAATQVIASQLIVEPAVQASEIKSDVFAMSEVDQSHTSAFVSATDNNRSNPNTQRLITVQTPSQALQNVSVGQVLVFSQDANFPYGFAGRITEISKSANSVTLGFANVDLGELFGQLKIGGSNVEVVDPVFYPVLSQPETLATTGVSAKTISQSKAVPKAIKYEGKYDSNTKTYALDVTFTGAITKNSTTKKFDISGACGSESNDPCLQADFPINFTMSNIKFDSNLDAEVSKGVLVNGHLELSSIVSSSIGVKIPEQSASVKKTKYVIAANQLLKKLVGDSQYNNNGNISLGRADGKGFQLDVHGVKWPDDRQAIGSLVWRLRNVARGGYGVLIPDVNGGSRDVMVDPQIFMTLYVSANGEITGQAELKISSPKYSFGFGYSIDNNTIDFPDDKNHFDKVSDASVKASAKGGVGVEASVGVAVGLGVFGIVPIDATVEAGAHLGIDGQLDYKVGEGFSGCHTDVAATYGFRSYLDIAIASSAKYVKQNGKVKELANFDKSLHVGLFNDKAAWNADNTIFSILFEDTCHAPKIVAANWLGGDFVNQKYEFEIDASATSYQPLVKYMDWDYGDGVTEHCDGIDIKECYIRRHTYNTAGKKNITLSVVYKDESSEVFSIKNGQIRVNASYPNDIIHDAKWTVDIVKPLLNFNLTPRSGQAAILDICAACTKDGTTYFVDWGDGIQEEYEWLAKDTQLRHTYSEIGEKSITVTMHDKYNSTFALTKVVNVQATNLAIVGTKIQQAGKAVLLAVEGAFNDVVAVVWHFLAGLDDKVTDISQKVSQILDVTGFYEVTATTYDVDGLKVGEVKDQIEIIQAQNIKSVTPDLVTRTVPSTLVFEGEALPAQMRVQGENGVTCGNPVNPTETSFSVSCTFPRIDAYLLTVYNAQTNRVVGTATVTAKTNVTGVTWQGDNGTVKFGDTITYTVEGINLTSGMGFAVEKCGVSNTEVGTGTDTERTFQCFFNPNDGAFAGQMAGVVKDYPDGQALFEFNVPVEVAPSTTTGLLNDTGITQCSNESTLFADCTAASMGGWFGLNQDGETGRDVLAVKGTLAKTGAGDAGFDFTKISATGQTLPANATAWSCVQDNHTGLMWEVKTDDGGTRDKDNTYQWYNTNTATNGGAVGYENGGKNTQAFTQAVNAQDNGQGLCGHNDWRLPSKQELHSIVNYGKYNPAIDSAYFPNTVNSYYWSSSPVASFSNRAWIVDFYDGNDGSNSKNVNNYVRLVRSGQ
ncbi:MAG: DUF1566 domain-containing protein [Pseudomonadales bacterium]|nr:DUF1566 domain-containing protein [Pseudomonadales bacterium]